MISAQDQARNAVISYLAVARCAEKGAENLTWPIHPSLQAAYDILEPIFGSTIITGGDGQGHLNEPERWTVLLKSLPELAADKEKEPAATVIGNHWAQKDCAPKAKWTGLKNWINDTRNASKAKKPLQTSKKQKTTTSGNNNNPVDDGIALELWKYDTVFKYAYPRLDENVSKMRNHLLKAPFAVHPKTGRVCIPFDPSKVDDFDPLAVPTLGQLAAEIDSDPDKSKSDLDKTSLGPVIHFFRSSFLKPLLNSVWRNERRERERIKATQGTDF